MTRQWTGEDAEEINLVKFSMIYCVVIPAIPMDINFTQWLESCNMQQKGSCKSARDYYWPFSSLIYKHLPKKRK